MFGRFTPPQTKHKVNGVVMPNLFRHPLDKIQMTLRSIEKKFSLEITVVKNRGINVLVYFPTS